MGNQQHSSTPPEKPSHTVWKALAPVGLFLGIIALSLSYVLFPTPTWPNVIVTFCTFVLAIPSFLQPSSFASTWHFLKKFANMLLKGLSLFSEAAGKQLKIASAHVPSKWRNYLTIAAIFLAITSLGTRFVAFGSTSPQVLATCAHGTRIISQQDPSPHNDISEPIGISDGCYVFTSPSGKVDTETDLSETMIYGENQKYLSQPHITIIVPTMLTGTDPSAIDAGTATLKGAAVEQLEYNKKLASGQLPLVLLVANSGTDELYANMIAQDIIQLAHKDHSIIGMAGWLFSTNGTLQAVQKLSDAGILSISPSITSNKFTDSAQNFLRIVPPDLEQGIDMARFAKERLHIQHLVICVDYQNPYSASLADSVYDEFNDNTHSATIEQYTRNTLGENSAKAASLGAKIIADVGTSSNAALFFAGYGNDLNPVRGYLLSNMPSLPVLGGDGLELIGKDNNSNYKSVYYTTFAYNTIWSDLHLRGPEFFSDYIHAFNGNGTGTSVLGEGAAEGDAIQLYDSMLTLVTAYQKALEKHLSPTASTLRTILLNTPVMGASGLIQIGSEGNPINKAIMVIHVNDSGGRELCGIYGQLLQDAPTPQLTACIPQP